MKFTLHKPFETEQAVVEVDAGLPSGAYRFQLVVLNQSGLRSDPAEVVVHILQGTETPPLVLDPRAVTPIGRAPVTPAVPLAVTPRRRRRSPNPPTP